MLTPEGTDASTMDEIMLHAKWTKTLQAENPTSFIIPASMGDPSYPIPSELIQTELDTWQQLDERTQKARRILKQPSFEEATDLDKHILQIENSTE